MTHVIPRDTAPVHGRAWRSILLSWSVGRVIVMVIAVAGVSVLLYGPALAWFADRAHGQAISGYVRQQDARGPSEKDASEVAAAHAYNASLPSGALRDPFAVSPQPAQAANGSDAARYLAALDLGHGGLMGVLTIPKIGVNLPIYHGTSEAVLDRGIGHLYGSALPVGGAGTHSVLAGHAGLVGDTLLSKLNKVRLGDTFTVTVLDQVLTYRVDQIKVVLPTQIDALASVPGKDYLTLLTCTPIGVNSHRLLVRGIRMPTPSGTSAEQVLHAATGTPPPWFALEAAAALFGALLLTSPLARKTAPSRERTL